MEIFFIIIFLLVIVWAWNADNNITLETEEDLSTDIPIKNQKTKSKTNTKNNNLIESFKRMNMFEKTKFFMFGWKRPPMPFLVKLGIFLFSLFVITFPLVFIVDGKYEWIFFVNFGLCLFVGYFAKIDDFNSLVEKAFEKEFGMTQEEFFYGGDDNSSVPIYQSEDLDKSDTPIIEKINEYSSLTNRNGDNLMLAHVYFLYCLIYISLIIGIYLTN